MGNGSTIVENDRVVHMNKRGTNISEYNNTQRELSQVSVSRDVEILADNLMKYNEELKKKIEE